MEECDPGRVLWSILVSVLNLEYRTRQKIAITELGKQVHLSPSNISKYENAKLSIDVCTLLVLQKLLMLRPISCWIIEEPVVQEKYRTNTINFFRRSSLFYMYQHLWN